MSRAEPNRTAESLTVASNDQWCRGIFLTSKMSSDIVKFVCIFALVSFITTLMGIIRYPGLLLVSLLAIIVTRYRRRIYVIVSMLPRDLRWGHYIDYLVQLCQTKHIFIIIIFIIIKLTRRLRWAGHVIRMEESRSAFKILTGKPAGKIPLGVDGRTTSEWTLKR